MSFAAVPSARQSQIPFAPSALLLVKHERARRGESASLLSALWCALLPSDKATGVLPLQKSAESLSLYDETHATAIDRIWSVSSLHAASPSFTQLQRPRLHVSGPPWSHASHAVAALPAPISLRQASDFAYSALQLPGIKHEEESLVISRESSDLLREMRSLMI
jgi:hypothetical protein